MKVLRLPLVLGLFLSLGCMCGDMDAFQKGINQGLEQSIAQVQLDAQKLPPGPESGRLDRMLERAKGDAKAGRLELMNGSVWLGEVQAAIGDGAITAEELAELDRSYKDKVPPLAAPPG